MLDTLDPAQLGVAAAAGMGVTIGVLKTTLKYIKKKVDSIDSKLDKLDERIDNHEARIIRLEVPSAARRLSESC